MLAFCSRRIEPVRQSNRRYITSLHATDSVLATYNRAGAASWSHYRMPILLLGNSVYHHSGREGSARIRLPASANRLYATV